MSEIHFTPSNSPIYGDGEWTYSTSGLRPYAPSVYDVFVVVTQRPRWRWLPRWSMRLPFLHVQEVRIETKPRADVPPLNV